MILQGVFKKLMENTHHEKPVHEFQIFYSEIKLPFNFIFFPHKHFEVCSYFRNSSSFRKNSQGGDWWQREQLFCAGSLLITQLCRWIENFGQNHF